ncbi:amino acid adenylation domain-containing protein [Burkholderia gladioli]|uniref:amino acid adenylation domain-containing protein n=7 Tax=Burkholderia gladioli TaxID=28095 RepID=UPI000CFFF2E7|nr:non-ribosomal peptide synthetase [Burkholderia gladioli]PRE81688.1 non-ribosomal peptide synthetase [Burkholderia gladioli]
MNQTVLLGEVHPLTAAQREIWLDQAVHGDAPVYKIGGYTRIAGSVDAACFERAVNLLVARHDALRLVLVPGENGEGLPRQAVAKTLTVEVPLHDFSAEPDPDAAAIAWARQRLAESFPLDGRPLFRFELARIDATNFLFTLNFHHLIVDGWAIGLLVDSLARIYSALAQGREPELDAPSYLEFVEQDRAFRESPQFERQRAYWLDKYRSVPDPLFAPRSRERFDGPVAPSGHHALCLPRAFYDRIAAFARRCESTPFHVILGLLHVYFSRTAQRDELAIGLPILNRSNARMRQTAGMFTGVSAVRLGYDPAQRFDELLKSLGQTLKQDYRHQRFPISELNRSLGLLQARRAQLFDISVSYERDDYDMRFGESPAQVHMCSNGHEQLPLALHIRENRFDANAWIHFMYNRAYFEQEEVEAIGARFEHLLGQVLEDARVPVADLRLPTAGELARLRAWSASPAAFERDEPLHRLFEARAAQTPDAVALEFEGRRLSYGELNAWANRVAHRLVGLGVKPDDRVAICVERGPGMIAGLLGVLKAGAGYVPLDPAYPAERLAYTLGDSAPLAVLVQAGTREVLGGLTVPVIDIDAPGESDASSDNPVVEGLNARSLAYVIYTSGSTGQPKGVMIEHRNVTRLFAATQAWYGFGPQDTWALFHSFAFDFSVWEIWGALLHGGRLVIVPKLTSRSPQACYALLCDTGVTVLNQTPSAFRQLIAAQAESDREHKLRHVVFGGEALEVGMLRPWYEDARNRDCQLVNMYGITETTVHVTYWPLSAEGGGTSAGIGRPIPDLSVHVLDANLNPVPIGVAGELCVGGAGVARGYLNQPELTARRFIRNPFSEDGEARLYRSGDLARFLRDGTLEYLGRIDTQVKIRGFRIELGEIEAALSALPGVREALVMAREDEPGEKRLVAYFVVDDTEAASDTATLRAGLSRTLPDFMLPAAFVALERFPLTANGKIDRKALPRPAQTVDTRQYVAPRTSIEERLAAIWAQVLHLDRVGIHDNFFAVGGDSIRAVSVLSKAKAQGLEFALVDLFTRQSIANLAQALTLDEVSVAQEAAALSLSAADQARLPAGIEDAYPLTYLQRGMVYHNQQASEDASIYHDVFSYRFGVPAWDEAKLRLALDAMTRRHPVLRTSFDFDRFDEPMQLVHAEGRVPLSVIDLSGQDEAEQARVIAEFVEAERKTRVALEVAPLLRVFIHVRGADEIQYTLSFHHAILDGWSVASLNTELFAAYLELLDGDASELELAPLAHTPRSVVESERGALASEAHREFWRNTLSGHSFSGLPPAEPGAGPDIARPELRVTVDGSLRASLQSVANGLGVPMRSVLLAAHLRVLSMLSGKLDVTTGLVSNVRQEQDDGEKVLGLFLNTLPLRQELKPSSWAELIRQTFGTELEVIRHRHYPYFQIQLDNDRTALYEVAFNYVNFHVYESLARHAGFEARGGHGFEATNFPFGVSFGDMSSGLSIDLKLDASRFSPAQGARILAYYVAALEAIATDAQADHSRADLLSRAEREQLLVHWNDTAMPFPEDACLHQLVEQQAARRPDAIAVIDARERLSYAELNARANQLAHRLRRLGIAPDDRVALCMERGATIVVAILAVMKAGGAYVPLDPAYPAERLAHMLADSAPVAALTDSRSRARLAGLPAAVPVFELDTQADSWRDEAVDDLPPGEIGLDAGHLAYVIYTSGSTGTPKGVMIEHRGLVNHAMAIIASFEVREDSRVLQFASTSFDASISEVVMALCRGAALYVPADGIRQDRRALWAYLEREAITHATLPPALLQDGEALPPIATRPTLTLAGEAPGAALFRALAGQAVLLNGYGPTEGTVCAAAWRCQPGFDDDTVPIGRPIGNVRLYLLDAHGQPVPVGTPGEIHIGGAGVARGYLNQPALSAARFLRDPFSETPRARMYRSGDLARYQPDGNLVFLGRNDDQVKIRGFRIELGEIEARLAEVEGVREVAVIVREDAAGDRRLVAYYTAADGQAEAAGAEALREHAANRLPRHMVPAAYVALDALPLTANGKLDRRALPAPEAGAYARRDYAAPQGEAERLLAEVWSALLGVEQVSRHDNFFELGGHSLLAVRLVAKLREAGFEADIQTLFGAPTLADLAASLHTASDHAVPPNRIPADARHLEPSMLSLVELDQAEIDAVVATVPGGAANVQDIYPLAPLQEGMLYHHLAQSEGDAYLSRVRFGFGSRAALERFVAALQAVVTRHDVLRTGIAWEGLREPVQVVRREARLLAEEVTGLDPALGEVGLQLQDRFDPRHFRIDLRQAPPMTIRYTHDAAADSWVLLLLTHHIALDHTDIAILLREVAAHLDGSWDTLPPPPAFRDHVARARLGGRGPRSEAFFRAMLSDVDEPTLPYGLGNLDADNGGERVEIVNAVRELAPELASRLRQQARRLGVSVASLFHLAWGHVVGKLSGREDVVFGTVLLGRWQGGERVEHVVGLFINTLPLRVEVGGIGVRDAALRTHRTLADLMGHEHASLAFAQRCSGVAAPAPLFSALLNFRHSAEGTVIDGGSIPGWQGIEVLDGEERTNYPCALCVDDLGEGFRLTTQLVAQFDAARVCAYLERAVGSLATALEQAPGTPVRELAWLPEAERRQLIEGWNASEAPCPFESGVHALFEAQAARTPDAPALVDGARSLDYGTLDARANRLAHHLAAAGVAAGERVAILLDRSIELILAELAILKCGAVYVPLDRNAPAERQAFMLADCGARCLLSLSGHAAPDLAALQRIDIDTVLAGADADARPDAPPPAASAGGDQAAYIMYTSGSTGQPKGVIIAHRGINRLVVNNGYAEFAPSDRIAFTSNPAFDASTMEVWGALLHGACLVVVPHEALLSAPRLAALLQAERVNILHLVAGLLSSHADALAPVFPRLRYLLTGGDAADVRAVQRIMRNGAPQHLVHCYGPTESTTFATTYTLRAGDEPMERLPIGRPISNTRVYLLDRLGEPAPVGVPGELHVGGKGVALGYLNLDALSAERFVRDPFAPAGDSSARMYRTGDLARYLPDGNIEYLGRNDDQVKIRGFRVEPGEIEAKLGACGLRDAVVIVREDVPGDKRLVVYHTDAACDVEAVREHLRRSLPEYMVPAAYVALAALPLTANGKLDRRALPAPDAAAFGQQAYEAPRGELEATLAALWSELLGVARVGRQDNFFALGGHSLLAVRVIGRLRERFGEAATLKTLFEAPSLAAFAQRLALAGPARTGASGDGGAARFAPAASAARREAGAAFPLSYVQERLWLIQQRDGGRAYNMNGALVLDGPLSMAALQAAFDGLVARHETLRTRFEIAAGSDTPSQFVDAPRAVALPVHEIVEADLHAALERHGGIEFDLRRAPLMDVRVLRITLRRHVVSIVMHHIVSDGWSLGVFVRDLRALYLAARDAQDGDAAAAPLVPLAAQYADYACWQREQDLAPHLAHWTARLDGLGAPVDLTVPGTPADADHGPAGVLRRRLSPALSGRLAQLSRQRGVSLFTIFLVALGVLHHRRSGREDFCIGTTTAGRDDALLEPLIGFFINILPLRLDLSGEPDVATLLARAGERVLEALEHQALPFEHMLAAVPALRQHDARSPVPVMLRHQNVPPVETHDWGGGLSLSVQQEVVNRQAQSDLDLEIFGDGKGLELVANYDSLRFDASQMDFMLTVLEELLARMADAPETSLAALREPTPAEQALVARSNDTRRAYPGTSVNALFARQLAERPDAPACVFEGEVASYAELDRLAGRIARALHRRGIGAGTRIALHYPRSTGFVAAILAAFRLGAAYVPIDPGYPAAYVRRTLDDAMPAAIVTTAALAPSFEAGGAPVLRLDVEADLEADLESGEFDAQPAFEAAATGPDDLAYIAYTSGSTGQPKGVMVEHRQLMNCLQALWERTPYAADEVVAQKTSMSFVPSIKEMLSGLLAGVPQVILPDAVVKDAPAFAAALQAHGVTRLNLVPSHLAVLLEHAGQLGALRHVTTAGEPLSRRLARRFAATLPRARLHNNYGCSELNDISYGEGAELAALHAVAPAGRPIANCRVHLLDERLAPVPVGAVGMLHVEGDPVGPGYWNRPDLTAERFVRHPATGAWLLRTGDLGQWLADGQLLHLGREDFQIKVRGQRVELPAVELELASHPQLAAAAAIGRELGGELQLVAYYVPRPGAELDASALHAWLAERLPAPMVPSRFAALAAMPLLPNGKLDRLALRALDPGAAQLAAGRHEAPVGELETLLARIWATALGLDRVGRHDNFFAIGGHSLMAAQVAVRASEQTGVSLSVRSIFDTRTVHRLAALVEAARAAPGEFARRQSNDASAQYVVFHAEGRQRPLFLTHTLQGYSWYFEHLAAHIDASIPVYGLPPLALGETQPRTLEAIAARFVAMMRGIQPEGPYRVAGWSFGGLIAYEIATQLLAQGQEIEFLGVFDTTLPPAATEFDAHRIALVTLYSFAMNNFSDFEAGSIDFEGATDIGLLIDTLVQAIEARREAGRPLWHLSYETARENRLFLERLVAHGAAMSSWRPRPAPLRMHVFAAADASITPLEGHAALPEALGWEALLQREAIEVVAVPGNHETIIKVHADVLGRAIGEVLNHRLALHDGAPQ